jgi:hypothetical protein
MTLGHFVMESMLFERIHGSGALRYAMTQPLPKRKLVEA